MTPNHVIERLKNIDEFIIVPKTSHELGLIWNAFIDANFEIYTESGYKPAKLYIQFFNGINSDFVKYSKGSISEMNYANIVASQKYLTDISEWFFNEVNNY